jgi:non-heme chloroperoxidase
MSEYRSVLTFVLMLISLPARLPAQEAAPWHDPSPHSVQFVAVDKDVKLEVLDWGGTGRPLVLLAGLGDTAHVFDDFAPQLTSKYHVYGITRRGFGASSKPDSGYSADRLGDDVLAVLDALKIERPVLAGHSIAGEELSSVGTRHPERVAGLIYLEAGYPYALYVPLHGDFRVDWVDLQNKVSKIQSGIDPAQLENLVKEMRQENLPELERDLRQMESELKAPLPPGPPPPTDADRANVSALRAWQAKVFGYAVPDAEVREQHEVLQDGRIGPVKPDKAAAVTAGFQKYTEIRGPVLAFFAIPQDLGPYVDAHSSPALLAAVAAYFSAIEEPQAKAFAALPNARVVRLPHALHWVYMSNEADVLREMNAFIGSLPQ